MLDDSEIVNAIEARVSERKVEYAAMLHLDRIRIVSRITAESSGRDIQRGNSHIALQIGVYLAAAAAGVKQ
jgi:hypothetical protein